MSESARPQGVGIHELLRYAFPGYTFLTVLLLPFMLGGTMDKLPSWGQLIVPLFVVGGLLIGYLLYHPYYVFFRNKVYTYENRRTLRTAEKLMSNSCRYQILAVHQSAMAREKSGMYEIVLFQFSVLHSIGVTLLSIWAGWSCSFLLAWQAGVISHPEFWIPVLGVLALLFFFSYFLVSEYRYRAQLAFEMENHVVILHLKEVIDELKKAKGEIEKPETPPP